MKNTLQFTMYVKHLKPGKSFWKKVPRNNGTGKKWSQHTRFSVWYMWGRQVGSIDKNKINWSTSLGKFSGHAFNRKRFFGPFLQGTFFHGNFFSGELFSRNHFSGVCFFKGLLIWGLLFHGAFFPGIFFPRTK